ncbi:Uncharacterized protein HZ326_30532 [Fusarium oxysporum f. sp. albedinis]|nr:Uncharacterized protein HZ326_30532 [Fusarium oxysporum f. sp. albedinis]
MKPSRDINPRRTLISIMNNQRPMWRVVKGPLYPSYNEAALRWSAATPLLLPNLLLRLKLKESRRYKDGSTTSTEASNRIA